MNSDPRVIAYCSLIAVRVDSGRYSNTTDLFTSKDLATYL